MSFVLTSQTPAVAVNLANVVAEKLRELIANGELAPGAQVTEIALGEAFGVSRGPAREAMKKLTQEGLLHYERSRGTYVQELTDSDVVDIYRLRGAVETAALEALIDVGDTRVLDALDTLVDKLEAAAKAGRWAEADSFDFEFHRTLVFGSRSARLVATFETLLIETRMCLRLLRFHHPDHPEIADWHRRIVSAVRAGDRDEMRRALHDHNATVLQDLLIRKEDTS